MFVCRYCMPYRHSPTCAIVTFRKFRHVSNCAHVTTEHTWSMVNCNHPHTQKWEELKSKLQHNRVWSAAAWPACSLCYRPAVFFCDICLMALPFPPWRLLRASQKCWLTWSKFHAEDPQILGHTVKNAVARDVCTTALQEFTIQKTEPNYRHKQFIPQPVLRQVHSVFQSEFATECALVLPLSIS